MRFICKIVRVSDFEEGLDLHEHSCFFKTLTLVSQITSCKTESSRSYAAIVENHESALRRTTKREM